MYLIFLIFIASQVSCIEIKSKQEFMKGETFLAELSGNILDSIIKEDVGFYKLGHVGIPLNYEIAKINSTYIIYSNLPYVEQNYTIRIKDVRFKENNQIYTLDIEKNFTVINSTAEFNVNPGFIISNKDFIVSIHNNLNSEININYELGSFSDSTVVPAQSDKEAEISISGLESTQVTRLKFSGSSLVYELQAYIIKNYSVINNTNLTDNNHTNNQTINQSSLFSNLSFYPSFVKASLNKGKIYYSAQVFDPILIYNLGKNYSLNITLSVSENLKNYINLSQNNLNLIKSNESQEINFTIWFTKTGNFEGFIYASDQHSSAKILTNFSIGENITENSSYNNQTKKSKKCSELKGVICGDNEVCEGYPTPSSNSFKCCIGDCKKIGEPKENGNEGTKRNWLVLGILILALLAIGAFLFLKMKKPKTGFGDILKKKTLDYETGHETSGKLSRL